MLNEIKDGQPYKNCIYGHDTFKKVLNILSDDNEPPDYSDQVKKIKDWNYHHFTMDSNSMKKEVKAFNPINTTSESQATLNVLNDSEMTNAEQVITLVDNKTVR